MAVKTAIQNKITANNTNSAPYLLGIDIGSTTVKFHLQRENNIIFTCYERHFSKAREKTYEILDSLSKYLNDDSPVRTVISGSAGMGIAEEAGLPFVQEVFATGEAIGKLEPDTDVVIELGGEDAKIIFFDKSGLDERMNGSCAGGTGAFIDQMAVLLDVSLDELDKLSLKYTQIYPIASRCGVFAKSDIQPLINQGAKKEDICASVYQAVVNQTIAGLAQGRKISGKIVFLGGALYYCKGLRKRFIETLNLDEKNAVTPEYASTSVAYGAALYAEKNADIITYAQIKNKIRSTLKKRKHVTSSKPLFADKKEYEDFCIRHSAANVEKKDISKYHGEAYLGIDCGSTTTKLVLIDKDKNILYSYYAGNNGDPVDVVKNQLIKIYSLCSNRISIKGSAVTGYGEELIKSAFGVDFGFVETIAHYTAAKHFNPDVEFVLDIGGQDIKCFKIRNNAIDSIMLNEACSSGCGSFIETFAAAMGYSAEEFSRLALFAEHPVDLGSRCTVFMNSSVKQAQRDGASIGDISAGLSSSVVKNALYKVIRASSPDELGKKIVVQGGTFLSDAVLKAFEDEIKTNVIRPNIAGLMGAFGAALCAMQSQEKKGNLISPTQLEAFTHTSKPAVCSGCTNHCNLTINTFSSGKRYISGNKCEKGAGKTAVNSRDCDLYDYKYKYITALNSKAKNQSKNIRVGLPLALGMYDLAPFWNALFTTLGCDVIFSGRSNKEMYIKGQHTIASDTACYPAKLMHGHIESLIEKKPDFIFYPSLTYNVVENNTDNCFNCPVVAYYGELISKNIDNIKGVKFIYPYLNINNKKVLVNGLFKALKPVMNVSKKEISLAVQKAYIALNDYRKAVSAKGKEVIEYARKNNKRILIFAGRPYHIDPEINHGINSLASSLGFAILSEDSVCDLSPNVDVNVLNQWTYHSRMYKAAQFASQNDDIQLVQLVSFGCGIDAVTTDEIKRILESNGKLYTQIKIDEITNLGAVKIRLRSLIGALDEQQSHKSRQG
ncbi:MAG: acyl-CoA dehydratase activase [Clostridiales bacterium]|nr:acyl-CoA dehydratase activase [Clostridiales bacterium]